MLLQIIPASDTIPVNWWWFEILLIVTFFIHIVLMNFVLGGGILTLFDVLKGKKVPAGSKSIPTLIALTVNFGIPPLLFLQVLFGNFFYTSSVLMAVPWLLVIPMLILAYYAAYIFVYKSAKQPTLAKAGLIISSILTLIIAFFFTNNSTLMLNPSEWGMYFESPGGNALNWNDPVLFPRFLHFIFGAVAVAGLGKALYFHFSRNVDPDTKNKNINTGLKIFAHTTILQVLIGLWFLIALPKDIMMLFMGKDMLYTILLMSGILLSIITIVLAYMKKFTSVVLLTVVILMMMIVVRELLKFAYLNTIFSPSEMTVNPQYSPFIVFLIVFVIGLYSLYYMINLIFKPAK